VLRLGVGVCLLICIGALLAALIPAGVDAEGETSITRVLVSTLCFQVGSLGLAWRFLREHQTGWATGFGFGNNLNSVFPLATLTVGLFLPLGWGLQVGSRLLMDWMGLQSGEQLALTALRSSPSVLVTAGFSLVTVLLAPAAEEVLFRGILYPALKEGGFASAAKWITSMLFALIHFNVAAFVPLVVLALVLVWLYEKTDNLLAPIAAHAIFNTVNLVLFFAVDGFARVEAVQP